MAAPSVSTDLTRITDSQSTTNWSALGGGGAGLTAETDFYIQDTLCISKQISGAGGAYKGHVYDYSGTGSANTNGTGTHIYIWMYMSTNQLPASQADGGLRAYMSSNGNETNDWREWFVYGNDTYARGGWKRLVIDPNVNWSANDNPDSLDEGSIIWFGCQANVTGTSKGTNLGIDAMDFGTGHRIEDGDGTTQGSFANIVAFDDDANNRYGVFYSEGGQYLCQGRLYIGPSSGNNYCRFDDTAATITFPILLLANTTSNLGSSVSQDLMGVTIEGVNTDVTWTDINLISAAANQSYSRGELVINSSNSVLIDGGTFDKMQEVTLEANTTLQGVSIKTSGFCTQNGATITECTFDSAISNSALVANNANLVTDCTFNMNTTLGGHAILIDTTGEFNLSGLSFNDYATSNGDSNAAIFNDSGGAVILNIIGGSDVPTIENGSGATTSIVAAVSITFTGIRTGSEIRIYDSNTTEGYEPDSGSEAISGSVQSAAVVAGGSGYSVSDVLTVQGGTGSAAQLTVSAVSSGAVTEVTVTTPGSYTVDPTSPASVTGGGGSGATFNLDISGSHVYAGTASEVVTVVVFHLNYKDIRLSNFTMPTTDSSIPLTQIVDRVYTNP